MAHFFTKHEMKKYDKKLSEENLLDTNRFKSELKDEISRDNHRTNIDSAKKKAVLQFMNYDGFHQMVLGADLKGLKQGQIYSIGSEKTNTIMNNSSTQSKFKDIDILQNAFTVNDKQNKIPENILNSIEETNEINFDQKCFIKELKIINVNNNSENDDKLNLNLTKKFYLINSFGENFRKILEEAKLPSDIFLDLVNSLGEILRFFIMNNDFEKISEFFYFVENFFTAKFYASLKIFIGKKQKNLYAGVVELLEKFIFELKEDSEKRKCEEIINFVKVYFK